MLLPHYSEERFAEELKKATAPYIIIDKGFENNYWFRSSADGAFVLTIVFIENGETKERILSEGEAKKFHDVDVPEMKKGIFGVKAFFPDTEKTLFCLAQDDKHQPPRFS